MPACNAYHVPRKVQPLIDYITPGIKLLAPTDELTEQGRQLLEKRGHPASPGSGRFPGKPAPKPATKWRPSPAGYSLSPHGGYNQSDLSTCDIAITPACVAALYQIPPAPKHVDPSNTMGIFEAELQYWDQLDLDLFFTNFTHWIPNGTHPIDNNVDGGVAKTTNVSEAGGESMLDLEVRKPWSPMTAEVKADETTACVPHRISSSDHGLECGRHTLPDLGERYVYLGLQYVARRH